VTGTYVLRLSGSDGEKSSTDEVTIIARPPPTNQAPVVGAGTDQSLVMSAESVATALAGSVSDDGLPVGAEVIATWSMVSGPAEVVFGDPAVASTTATFTAYGDYVLKLEAADGVLFSSDEVSITVAPPPPNQPPVVQAGADRSGSLGSGPAVVALTGSATDDGLPAGSALTWSWSQSSGPATVVFSNATNAATQATFSAAGNYVLRLTVSDGELATYDEVAVTISAQPPAPVSFSPTHDAYLQDGKGFNNSDLRAEFASRVRVSYLQFDLSSFGSTPAAARLRFVESSDTSDGIVTLRLYAALSNAWNEANLTAGNAPAKGPEIATFTGNVTDGMVVEFDVGSKVTAPGIYSFILEMGTKNRDVAFGSAENKTAALRPLLLVTPRPFVPMAAMAITLPPDDAPRLRVSIGPDATTLSLKGLPGIRYTLERSTDLEHWTPLSTLSTGAAGDAEFADPEPPVTRAFYRAMPADTTVPIPEGESDR